MSDELSEAERAIWQEGYDASEDCQEEDLRLLRLSAQRLFVGGEGLDERLEDLRRAVNAQLGENEQVPAIPVCTEERERALRDAARELSEAACNVTLVEWSEFPHCKDQEFCLGKALCQRCRVRRLKIALLNVSDIIDHPADV